MSFHDHSSIKITTEMPDFDCLHMVSNQVISPTVQSATECRLCIDLESVMAVACHPSCHNRMLAAERLEVTESPAARRAAAGHPQWLVQ